MYGYPMTEDFNIIVTKRQTKGGIHMLLKLCQTMLNNDTTSIMLNALENFSVKDFCAAVGPSST